MGSIKSSRGGPVKELPTLASAVAKHFTNQTLILGGRQVPGAQVLAELRGYLALLAAVDQVRVQLAARLDAARRSYAGMQALVRDLKAYLRVMYASSRETLNDFGMQPARKRKRTITTKLAAIAKSKATRVTRHTMGPKQRAKLRGK